MKDELIDPEEAKQLLKDVPDAHHFRLHMGTNIRNLEELGEALEIMAEDSFKHHVSKDKNDFAKWVQDIFKDETLAEDLKKLKTKDAMAAKIDKRIYDLRAAADRDKICPKDFLTCGATDFLLGAVIGFLIGLVFAVLV